MLEAVSKSMFDEAVSKLTSRLLKGYGWKLLEAAYPILDVVFEEGAIPPLRVRLMCDGWNDLPPSIALLTPAGVPIRTPYTGLDPEQQDPAYLQMFSRSNSVLNMSAHDSTGLPFVCMRGSREFHTHSSHRAEAWDNYRNQSGNDLIGLVVQLWRVWRGR